VPVENRAPTAETAMALAFDFDFNSHFDYERTTGAVKGEDGTRYTAEARVPTAVAAMALPFDFHSPA